jgi:hypothetical protein
MTAPANASPQRTVLGMPAIGGLAMPPPGATIPDATMPGSALGSAPGPQMPASGQKTMLGVAIPGIAPLAPGSPSQGPSPPSSAPLSAGGARVAVQNENRTMVGVPAPGALPAPQPIMTGTFPVAPAPPPLELEPLPSAPRIVKRKGAPLGLVFGGLTALVAGVGGAAIFLVKTASPLVVQPRLSPKGTDLLHIACETCPDGTRVALRSNGATGAGNASSGGANGNAAAASAEFKNKTADLELASPLVVGENALVLALDRPGMGRDEEVKAAVPVRYRIRTDLSAVGDATPALKIVVEAEPGAHVTLDGKPVSLDASGHGALSIDLSAECTGMADETRTIEKNVAYEVALKDHTEKGAVTARVGVPALRVDAPLTHTVIAADRFFVAGRTVKGASITVNGRPVTVDPAGIFAEPFGAPTATDVAIEVRASMPSTASRTVSLKLRRSEALESQARSAEKAQTAIGSYSDLVSHVASYAGKTRAIEGDLVELRSTNHQSVLLVNAHGKQCDRPGGCMVRVVHGAETDAKPGRKVLVVGRVTRTLTAGASTVPEIEAEFVVPLGGSAHR